MSKKAVNSQRQGPTRISEKTYRQRLKKLKELLAEQEAEWVCWFIRDGFSSKSAKKYARSFTEDGWKRWSQTLKRMRR